MSIITIILFDTIICYCAHIRNYFVRTSHATCHMTDSLIALPSPFIVQHIQSNELSWNGRFLFSASNEVYRDLLLCAFAYMSLPHAYCCWFMLGMCYPSLSYSY